MGTADFDVQRQLKQIIAFIEKEASEKVEELQAKTDQEFNIEKGRLFSEGRGKLLEYYEKKDKQLRTQQKVKLSQAVNRSRIRILKERAMHIETLRKEAIRQLKQEISNNGSRKNEYKKLVEDLLLQSLYQLMEEVVYIVCRKKDVELVEEAILKTKEIYEQKTKLSVEIYVDNDEYLSKDSCGGVIAYSHDSKIKCNNELDDRLNLIFEQILPQLRTTSLLQKENSFSFPNPFLSSNSSSDSYISYHLLVCLSVDILISRKKMMDGTRAEQPYIDKRLSIITTTGIRYEGRFKGISKESQTLTLGDVRSMGNEDRRTDKPRIPPENRIFSYLVFRGQFIADIHLLDEKNQDTPYVDPAIMIIPQNETNDHYQQSNAAPNTTEVQETHQKSTVKIEMKEKKTNPNKNDRYNRNQTQQYQYHNNNPRKYRGGRHGYQNNMTRSNKNGRYHNNQKVEPYDLMRANNDFSKMLTDKKTENAENTNEDERDNINISTENDTSNIEIEQETKNTKNEYYVKDNFFDSISCEADDKATPNPTHTSQWKRDAMLNEQTFGKVQGRRPYNANRGRNNHYYNNHYHHHHHHRPNYNRRYNRPILSSGDDNIIISKSSS
ncbi:hypothetical protein SNEBB_006779 [Seison nebaliae]|nr:hypothetical protein SNEBB_006779 [Seison nebaliae]